MPRAAWLLAFVWEIFKKEKKTLDF